MSKIIAVVNQKGGVGKTTTTMNLAAYLAELGKFVLVVDMDPQGNATSGLGISRADLAHGIYEALAKQKRIHDVVINTNHEGLRLVPATQDLAGANIELVDVERREFQLGDLLEELRHAYDYILIDCPPSLGLLTINSLVAADEILIPVQAEYYALEGLGQLLQTIGLVKEHIKPEISVLGAVLTMFDKRTKLAGDVMEELYKYFPDNIFRSVIPRNVRLAEAPSFGKSIFHYDPKGKGARAYERLAREILEKHSVI
ncbi:MAG: ParA family protein [Candidatus Magasanikbacteria bacterium]|jgi:chromosome partitioning protein|nr:ParA family protein [Candidatus Magasanikbacteria bacterium]MBT4220825.1 ParA family protein [Candidatus Magasanikbacteria bacterium]MBT4350170.1 ParA family protein [Candidatus Magasanikbacteria bacterium]MBT4541387.1 ParA family protein [Candidatus Magasanikbacteria bacterium]MBT6253173.1 ParA family protein [Candidatus Magasanikbacteria bacterium]